MGFLALLATMVVVKDAHAGNGYWDSHNGVQAGVMMACDPIEAQSWSEWAACALPIYSAGFGNCSFAVGSEDTQSLAEVSGQPGVWQWNAQIRGPGFSNCTGGTVTHYNISLRYTITQDPPCVFDAEKPYSDGVCVGESDCEPLTDLEVWAGWSQSATGSGEAPSCIESATAGQCAITPVAGVSVCIGDSCGTQVKYTGAGCPISKPATTRTADVNCIAGPGGQLCFKPSAHNCGTFNGQPVCLEAIPEGDCTFLANGGVICGDLAPSPPRPTTAEGGIATPDGGFEYSGDSESRREYDYFSPATVAASQLGAQGGGPGPTGGFYPDGTEEGGNAPGECELFAETLCEIRDWLTGGDEGDLDELPGVPTEEVTFAEWDSGLGSGSCPQSRSFSFGGQSMSYSYQIACDNAYLFRAVLLMCAAVASGMILLGVRG